MQKNLFTIANKVKITLAKESWVIDEYEFPNITCTAGRTSLARRLVDLSIPELWYIKYIAIWDGSTAAAEWDIVLNNELYRMPISVVDTIVNWTIVKVYARFPRGIVMTVREAWLFIDGTATAINGSGTMLAHSILPTPVSKLTDDVLSIERTVSVVNSII